jgi:HEAT repeat protein
MRSRLLSLGLCAWLATASLAYSQDENSYTPRQRILRIRELGKKGSEAIPGLSGYLSDSNRDIRIEAVKAIVKIDTERSLDPLVKATTDNDAEVQIRATDGLVNFYQTGYVVRGGLTGPFNRGVRQIRSYFEKRDDEVINSDIKIRPDVAEAIGNLVKSGSSYESRANAARAAGILRDRAALPNLVDALQSKKTDIIFESLVALQKIGDASVGPRVTFLTGDFDERVQTTALETIGVLHSTESAPEVRRALTNGRSVKARRAALQALAMLALPDDRTLFKEYLSDRDDDLRASALEGLARLREPEDYPDVERVYNEQNANPKLHLAAAFGLVSQGKVDTSEFSPLLYLFQNLDSKAYKDDALRYLTELCRRKEVRSALFPLAATATVDEKLGLCSAFAESHDPDVMPTLETLSKDIDPNVSVAAAKAMKTVQARKPL